MSPSGTDMLARANMARTYRAICLNSRPLNIQINSAIFHIELGLCNLNKNELTDESAARVHNIEAGIQVRYENMLIKGF